MPRVLSVAVVNALGAVLLLLLNFLLARLTNEQAVGAYNIAWAWIEVLVVLGMLGFDKLAMRDVAYCLSHQSWGKLRGLLIGSTAAITLSSLILASTTAVIAWRFLPSVYAPLLFASVLIGLTVVPMRALAFHLHAILIAMRRSLQAQIPMFIGQPLFTIVLVLGLILVFGREHLTGPNTVAASSISAFLVMVLSAIFCTTYLPKQIRSAQSQYDFPAWIKIALPMMLIASMSLINIRADIIMLGAFRSADNAGVYAIASRLSEVIRFGALAVNPVIVGLIARHHATNEKEQLRKVIRISYKLLLLWSAIGLAMVMLFGSQILSLFGGGFQIGYIPLLILALGQFMTIALGPVDSILIMTGHHHAALAGLVVATIANITLNLMLIPMFGMAGAAIATATSATLWSIILAAAVVKRLHFRPFAF